MADDERATAFVTGAGGFPGTEWVKVARGHHVFALTRSLETAQSVRRVGAMPVIGDLLTPGRWQDEAAADWGFHIPPARSVDPIRTRVSRKRAASMTRARHIRLRGTGSRFQYSTLAHGPREIWESPHE